MQTDEANVDPSSGGDTGIYFALVSPTPMSELAGGLRAAFMPHFTQ